ncbi:hypothetical protein KQ945_06315 [Bacillus subtilis subsp. subtilis]|nr:hypothetical protein [Bacillus subtilis subsp. subtilis]
MNARTVASVPVRRSLLGRTGGTAWQHPGAPLQRRVARADQHGRIRHAG